jgi:hypothetical protein
MRHGKNSYFSVKGI